MSQFPLPFIPAALTLTHSSICIPKLIYESCFIRFKALYCVSKGKKNIKDELIYEFARVKYCYEVTASAGNIAPILLYDKLKTIAKHEKKRKREKERARKCR